MNITKDSEKVICCLYKMYLVRRKNGESRDDARLFNEDFYKSDKNLSKWNESDIRSCIEELEDYEYVKTDIIGDIKLTDSTIKEMENRFKNGLSEVVDLITKLF